MGKGDNICNNGRCLRKKYKHYKSCEKCYNRDKEYREKQILERKKREKEKMDLIIECSKKEHPGYEVSIIYDENKLEYVQNPSLPEGEYIYIWLINRKPYRKGQYKIRRFNGHHYFETDSEKIKKSNDEYKKKTEKLIENKKYNTQACRIKPPPKFYDYEENIHWCINLIFKDKKWLNEAGELDYNNVYKLNKKIFKEYYVIGCMNVYMKNQDVFKFVQKFFKDKVPNDDYHYEGKWLPWLMEANNKWRTKENMKWWFRWVCKLENIKSPKKIGKIPQNILSDKYNGAGVLSKYQKDFKNDNSKHYYIEMIIELSPFEEYDFYNNLNIFTSSLNLWYIKNNRLKMVNKMLKETKKDKLFINYNDFKKYDLMGLYCYYVKNSDKEDIKCILPEMLNDLFPRSDGNDWYHYRYKMMFQKRLCDKNFKNMTMEMIEKYNIKTPEDWYKINYNNMTYDFICGSSLMAKHNGYINLIIWLVKKYAPKKLKPENWNCDKFYKSSLQQICVINILKSKKFIIKKNSSFCFENNTFTIEYKFNECRYKHKLPFDIIFVYYNIIVVIEIDGIQHFKRRKSTKWGPLGIQFKKDKIKTNFMLTKEFDKKHIFIRIPYTKGGQASQGNHGKKQYEKDKVDIENVMNEIFKKVENDEYNNCYFVFDKKLYSKQYEERKKYEILEKVICH
tara:strand:+ start:523 stop:2553 length:2031 start_codon:yes stop_codon:yes gene_type:complete